MVINEETKIAALLKHHPDALETIVALSPDFTKLRNPLLRKLMAGRTTIRMASKIGGCSPVDFFRALAPLGFESGETPAAPKELPQTNPLPEYLRGRLPEQIIRFDVRSMLAGGADPLRPIQEKVKALKTGQALVIINSFEPVPLIKLLERQGFHTWVDTQDADTIETWFYRTEEAQAEAAAPEPVQVSGGWENLLQRFDNQRVDIDVRHLEMPGPMMMILENLEVLPDEHALFVHHKRIPVFLLTELKERQWDYRIKETKDGEVYLLIFKDDH